MTNDFINSPTRCAKLHNIISVCEIHMNWRYWHTNFNILQNYLLFPAISYQPICHQGTSSQLFIPQVPPELEEKRIEARPES